MTVLVTVNWKWKRWGYISYLAQPIDNQQNIRNAQKLAYLRPRQDLNDFKRFSVLKRDDSDTIKHLKKLRLLRFDHKSYLMIFTILLNFKLVILYKIKILMRNETII